MGKFREFVKHMMPKKVIFSVDGINIPCYNLDIAGGVLMSNKNKPIPINDISIHSSAINNIAETVQTMHAQTQAMKLQIDNNTRIIIQDENVPEEIRVQASSNRDEVYRLESKNRQKLIIDCAVLAAIVICFGIASGTAVKLYTVKYAA